MSALTIDHGPVLRRLPVPVAEPRAALRVVPETDGAPSPNQGVLPLLGGSRNPIRPVPEQEPPRAAPPVAAWTRQFVQAAIEVGAGRRPPSQLIRWASEEVLNSLARRAALSARAERTAAGPTGRGCAVRSVHLCRPCDGVVEACAVVTDRGRVRALALRIEQTGDRWRVTALEMG
jgi:hypothetical protein